MSELKSVFIDTKYKLTGNDAENKEELTIPKKVIDKLPSEFYISGTIQYNDFLDDYISQLENTGKKVKKITGEHSTCEGQMLGCDVSCLKLGTGDGHKNNFMYIGDGLFHPKMALIGGYTDVYCYNPKSKELTKIDEADIKKVQQRVKAGMLKFVVGKNIGILVTTKWGQERLNAALQLKKKIIAKYPDKKVIIMIADTMDFGRLIDFNFLDCYINTMCPRIGYDDTIRTEKPMLDYTELIKNELV